LEDLLAPARGFAAENRVPLGVNEFGAVKHAPGVGAFLTDELTLFEEQGWNWAVWVLPARDYPGGPAFDFRRKPRVLEVLRRFWAKNDLRPSSVTFQAPASRAKFRSKGRRDGWVRESKEASGRGKLRDSAATTLRLGDDHRNRQYRSILHFDTSRLPEGAVITKATLKIKRKATVGTDPFEVLGPLLVDVRRRFFGPNSKLASSDFQAKAHRKAVGRFKSIPGEGGWHKARLESTAFPYVNTRSTTQVRLRFRRDDSDDRDDDFLRLFSGDAGKAKRPVLTVDYFVP
jgi:hypothetical protein